jgi:hypothetical protein
MTDVPEGAQLSEDGQWWWDGEQWQPVGGGTSESTESYDQSYEQSTTNQIDADEYPSLARVLYFGEDVDGYLQDLGIDTAGLDTDEPAEPPLVS